MYLTQKVSKQKKTFENVLQTLQGYVSAVLILKQCRAAKQPKRDSAL